MRIICLTEESVEFLYDLGMEDLIVGVSTFVERPKEAKSKPTVSAFTHANLKKIIGLNPDLVIGFSDIQKDIARDLIAEGLNVFISNHRSIEETFDYLELLGRMIDQKHRALNLINQYRLNLDQIISRASHRSLKPKVYLEEWDSPMIRGIQWFSEVVQLCGGEDIFSDKKNGSLAKNRIIEADDVVKRNPDIILASWCGKPVEVGSFAKREGWSEIEAVKNSQIYELKSDVILQPGPALFKEAIFQVDKILTSWSEAKAL